MRKERPNFLLLCALLVFTCATLGAQTYPSALSTAFVGPRTLFLDEYADPFQPRIRTTIYFTDFSQSSWTFDLRIKISGPGGILIQSKKTLRSPGPFVVSPGQPFVIEGADLSWYLNYNNLDFSGISRARLESQNHRLPEGLYTITFEALDYESGKALSLPSQATSLLSLNDPAIVVSPLQGALIENAGIQNVMFQWQISNPAGNLNLTNLNYQIDLYEVNNAWSNPVNAIMNNQAVPIWQSAWLSQNFYLYGLAEPPLEKGKRYVFTVRTNAINGRNCFKNDGVSTPRSFQFGYLENDTIDITLPDDVFQFALSTPSQFKWKKPRHALQNQLVSYTLKLVELLPNQSPQAGITSNPVFFQQSYMPVGYNSIDKTIPVTIWMNIKRMGRYAWQVTGSSGGQMVARSPVFIFYGPPAIESFIAGGFLMKVIKLDSYDTVSRIISGKCSTTLNPAWGNATEFRYQDISLSSIGNNEWVMSSGSISDKISPGSFTLQPQLFPDNNTAIFSADSVFVNTSGLKLSGITEWKFPHACASPGIEYIRTKRARLSLSNGTYKLNNNEALLIDREYRLPVLEPLGFIFRLSNTSFLNISQSQYLFSFNGFVALPQRIRSNTNGVANMAFANAGQLHYLLLAPPEGSDELFLTQNNNMSLQVLNGVLDFSEVQSPGKFSGNQAWKGLYIGTGSLKLPPTAESSGQITLPARREFTFSVVSSDSNVAYADYGGLYLKTLLPFFPSDSIKFNRFTSKSGEVFLDIRSSEVERAFLRGAIIIPLLDTINTFQYQIPLTDHGFEEGYLTNGLSNHSFTFNPAGASEQKVKLTIRRAVFRNHDRLELDADVSWPHFSLEIGGVQGLGVWGNGNIGFEVPNGKSELVSQASGKSSGYPITVDYIGCGRDGNAYALGISAHINMDEEISGENGPPVVNAYSLYRNPLLTGSVTGTPIVSVSTSSSSNAPAIYQSATAGYTANVKTGLGDAVTALGFNAADTSGGNFVVSEENIRPLLNGNSILQLKQLIDIIIRLKSYFRSNAISDKDWMVLQRFRNSLDHDVVRQGQLTNGKEVLNYVLNKLVESMINEMNGSIQTISDKAMGKIRKATSDKITGPVNKKIDQGLGMIFTRMEQNILGQVDEQYHDAVKSTLVTVRNKVAGGIMNSVSNSFEVNVNSKIAKFVQLGVTSRIKTLVGTEVGKAAGKLISDGASAQINLNEIVQHSGTVFVSIADTVKDVIMRLNGGTFVKTAESLVDDAISKIDWQTISANILNELLVKGISGAIASKVSSLVGENAGPYVQAALNMVKFDFDHLGDKVKNGQFDKIVKFDVTNIYMVTPALDVRGALKFKKNDSVFGDCWQADVMVRLKVPKKNYPVEISAFFLNGRTRMENDFTYWFAKLAATGFSVPMTPAPVIWDGVEGFAYSKMLKTGSQTVVPDRAHKFGIGAKFIFYDQATSGGSYIFDLGAEAQFEDGGFAIQMVGNASLFNYSKTAGKYHGPGFVTGTGTLGYYKTADVSKVAGNFNVQFNTQPLLCAGGAVGLDLRSPSDWKVWAGTPQSPIGVKLLCKDFLSNTAHFTASQSGFSAGLSMSVNVAAQSPWIEFPAIKVRGAAQFGLGYAAAASVEYSPNFKINDASVAAYVYANLGIEYQTSVTSNTLTIAGVTLSGALTFKSQPEAELHGQLAGSITVLNYDLAFTTPVNYSLSKQKILD